MTEAEMRALAQDPATPPEQLEALLEEAKREDYVMVPFDIARNPNLSWVAYRKLLLWKYTAHAALENPALPILMLDDPTFWHRFTREELTQIWKAAPTTWLRVLGPAKALHYAAHRKNLDPFFRAEFPSEIFIYEAGPVRAYYEAGRRRGSEVYPDLEVCGRYIMERGLYVKAAQLRAFADKDEG